MSREVEFYVSRPEEYFDPTVDLVGDSDISRQSAHLRTFKRCTSLLKDMEFSDFSKRIRKLVGFRRVLMLTSYSLHTLYLGNLPMANFATYRPRGVWKRLRADS